jgi:hypothetical protein
VLAAGGVGFAVLALLAAAAQLGLFGAR